MYYLLLNFLKLSKRLKQKQLNSKKVAYVKTKLVKLVVVNSKLNKVAIKNISKVAS